MSDLKQLFHSTIFAFDSTSSNRICSTLQVLPTNTSAGAQQFVENYYITLNGTSLPLPAFYASSNSKYTTCANPVTSDITINGAVLTGGPEEYEKMIKAQRQTPSGIEARVKYEVEGWDVHILNPEFTLACPENLLSEDSNNSKPDKRAKDNIKASLLLQVTGTVSYGGDREAPKKMFNDVFVLVPNWDTHVKNPPRNARRWLIMSQNFRAL